MQFIHDKCLDKWIETSGNGTTCPTCRGPYKEQFIVIGDSDDQGGGDSEMGKIILDHIFRGVIETILIAILITLFTDGQVTIFMSILYTLPIIFIYNILLFFMNVFS